MKGTLVITLLILHINTLILSFEPEKSLSIVEARNVGRLKSNYRSNQKSDDPSLALSNKADLIGFKKVMAPIFKKSCIHCHGPKKAKGKFRVDKLDPDLLGGAHINEWLEVYEVLSNEEMPPDDEPDFELTDRERSEMIDWLSLEMKKASSSRKHDQNKSSFRRMTKYEINYALQDLLGLPYEYTNALPPENISEHGFKNSSHLLQMSAMQFETHRGIALNALKKATVKGGQPKPVNFSLSMRDLADKAIKANIIEAEKAKAEKEKAEKAAALKKENEGEAKAKIKEKPKAKKKKKKKKSGLHIFNHQTNEKYIAENWSLDRHSKPLNIPTVSSNVFVLQSHRVLKLNLNNHLPDEGIMRIRIRAGRTTVLPNEYSSIQIGISAQTSNNANFSAIISQKDMPVNASYKNPEIIEFKIPLAEIPRNPLKNEKGKGRMVNEFITIRHVSNQISKKPLNLYIDYLDITGSYYEQWPPKSHEYIFFKNPNRKNEIKYARDVIEQFMKRAWRRAITNAELDRFAAFYSKIRSDFENCEEALLEVLATVLASPEFLYTSQDSTAKEIGISDLELANRLSLFLWSSIPDDELVDLAIQNKLNNPAVLKQQVDRMLSHPRAKRFSKHFVYQWLGIEGIKNISIDKKKYKAYNASLQKVIMQEPVVHFNEVLSNNISVLDFIHSDGVYINEELAKHYGIPNVYGPQYRKVKLNNDVRRGGVMTTAAMLTMNSDGHHSHPLKRGLWLIERMLNDPPPPPPPNVPVVDLTDPKILKMTLKERMANHRNNPACMSCHSKIDPWGVAFENYDATGAYRTKINDKSVDATSQLYNKQKLDGITGLKHYLLLDRQDQFVRSLVHKMTSYALGRHLTFKDRKSIDKIATKLRKKNDGLGDLISLIVSSELFHSK